MSTTSPNLSPDTPVTTPPATPDTPAPQDQATTGNLEWMDQLTNDSVSEPAEFLRIDDRTVYKTAESAQQGWNDLKSHADTLKRENEALRLSLAQGGSDDLIPALTTSVRDAQSPAFKNALQKIIRREVQSGIKDSLKALAPTLGHSNFNRAVEIASNSPKGDPNIANFVRSPAFAKMAENNPTLGNGIAEARFNAGYVEKELPEMLILAYHESVYLNEHPKAGAPPAENKSVPTTPDSTTPAQPIGKPSLPGGSDIKDVPWGGVNWSHQTG